MMHKRLSATPFSEKSLCNQLDRCSSNYGFKQLAPLLAIFFLLFLQGGCAKPPVAKVMEATAYCGCSKCCSWERGSWSRLKLDFWNRYVSAGSDAGRSYNGRTASNTKPQEPEKGLLSKDSVARPWMIPVRMALFPWKGLPQEGTIAADTKYYPFGTKMHVPGYGWGVVEDRGSAIKGPHRIDLYFKSHKKALAWGRRKVKVIIKYPGR